MHRGNPLPYGRSKMADGGGLASSKGLEQFVLLAKSAKGAAVVELINQALAAPGVFVFGELLEMSSVKEVRCRLCTVYLYVLCLDFVKSYTKGCYYSVIFLSEGKYLRSQIIHGQTSNSSTVQFSSLTHTLTPSPFTHSWPVAQTSSTWLYWKSLRTALWWTTQQQRTLCRISPLPSWQS